MTGKVHTLCRSFFVPHKYRHTRHLPQFNIVQSRLSRELLESGFLRFWSLDSQISLYPVVKSPHPQG